MAWRFGNNKRLAESGDWDDYGLDMKCGKALKQIRHGKAALMDTKKCERMTERLAMRQLLDASTKSIEEGRTFCLEEGFQTAREQIQASFNK